MAKKTRTPNRDHLKNWTLAKGGRSFDAGPFRVRSEAAGTQEDQMQVLKLASCAPRLLELVEEIVTFGTAPEIERVRIRNEAILILGQLKAAGCV